MLPKDEGDEEDEASSKTFSGFAKLRHLLMWQ
jgi:hypothetical protein